MRLDKDGAVGTLFAVVLGLAAPPIARAEVPANPSFSRDVAPIFQSKCEACHRPESIAPMSLRTFAEARPWARSIRLAGRGAADAALAHRQDRRRPGVQERPFAERRSNRHHRAVGGPGRAHRATRGTCHRRSRGRPSRNGPTPRSIGQDGARPHRPLDAVDAEGGRERHVVEAHRRDRADRAALGARRRSAAGHASRAARSRITPTPTSCSSIPTRRPRR